MQLPGIRKGSKVSSKKLGKRKYNYNEYKKVFIIQIYWWQIFFNFRKIFLFVLCPSKISEVVELVALVPIVLVLCTSYRNCGNIRYLVILVRCLKRKGKRQIPKRFALQWGSISQLLLPQGFWNPSILNQFVGTDHFQ